MNKGVAIMQFINLKLSSAIIAFAVTAITPSFATAEEMNPNEKEPLSLITESPDEGFSLAIALSRRAVTTIQPDKKVLHAERPVYAGSAEDLTAASHVVAVWFNTIAQANDYWRD